MTYEIVPLTAGLLDKLPLPAGLDRRSYFTTGSAAFCVMVEGEPVLAGGVVNLMWNRGEAWILPTPWFRSHLKSCVWLFREFIPFMAAEYGFRRVQATCPKGTSTKLFRLLGFKYEGTLVSFGPNGETCDICSRIFEVAS